jgi:integrase
VKRSRSPYRLPSLGPTVSPSLDGGPRTAIPLTLVLTGRRRAEVIGLRAGDLSLEGETCFYADRGKGGKRGRRELPHPAFEAIRGCARLRLRS